MKAIACRGIVGMVLWVTALLCQAQSNTRPQLSPEQAALVTVANVVGGANGIEGAWNPLADALVSDVAPHPDYIVDPSVEKNGATIFRSLQACLNRIIADVSDAAPPSTGRRRIFVLLKPGTYKELLYVPPLPVALTLYGIGVDALQTRISADLDATVSGADYLQRFESQFTGVDAQTRAMVMSIGKRPFIGTEGTPTAWIRDDGFQAKNITIENTYQMAADCQRSGCHEAVVNGSVVKGSVVHHQAVALLVDGADQSQFEQVRVLGHQDTLYLKTASGNFPTHSFFSHSIIEGDVDFIFGDATAYFDQSEIRTLADRPTSYMAAPSTNYATPFGFVFNHCRFTSAGLAHDGKFYLARQWFHNQKCTPYAKANVPDYSCLPGEADQYSAPHGTISKSVLETVGKLIIMNSTIGAYIDKLHPWVDWNAVGSLAYRPVQTNSDDYWQNLINAHIDPIAFMGYGAKKAPIEWFLAEFNNLDEK